MSRNYVQLLFILSVTQVSQAEIRPSLGLPSRQPQLMGGFKSLFTSQGHKYIGVDKQGWLYMGLPSLISPRLVSQKLRHQAALSLVVGMLAFLLHPGTSK